MEKELVELFEAAKKAADAAAGENGSSDEESRCLDALKELKDFPVNYQILVSTQVGKRLRHLTKHPRRKIQSFATDLIEIWKSIILEETSQKKNGISGAGNSVKVESVNGDSVKKPIPVKVEKTSRRESGKVEQSSPRPQKIAKTDRGPVDMKYEFGSAVKVESVGSAVPVKVERTLNQEKPGSSAKKPSTAGNTPPKLSSMIKSGDPIRDKMRELLLEALSKVSGEADENYKEEVDACDPIRVAVSVESVMYEKWGRSNGTHKFKYRSIMFNIKDANNPDFRRKVLLGYIKPERIVNLTAEEMASEQRRLENKQIEEKALFDCERGGPPKATTDQFKCGRCGQRKCTYYQLQTRSADEPMTTFVTCVNCNNHWKFC
ncbi:transcription elongation factor TFIIS-like [Amaranthus tricolor]|uniref:transcription elongation factor TFIIS-like n=1 Tax=Amaranthus tricolor TaxID=29722 RepID=UPI0025830C0E|nr:transcription elongation factor TFIIS-like [Amaranthus tricolor]XP_057533848.1 transcription elongation factor TFIIS-like [Amaranthus tricolor]